MQKVQYEPPTCVSQAMSQDSALLAGSPGKFDQVSDAEQLAKPTTPKFMDEWDDEEEVDDSTTYVWGIK